MVKGSKHLEDIIKGLSPEDKAKLVIEDVLRDKPVLSYSQRRKMLQAMSSEEGRRYNLFMVRFETIRQNLAALST